MQYDTTFLDKEHLVFGRLMEVMEGLVSLGSLHDVHQAIFLGPDPGFQFLYRAHIIDENISILTKGGLVKKTGIGSDEIVNIDHNEECCVISSTLLGPIPGSFVLACLLQVIKMEEAVAGMFTR